MLILLCLVTRHSDGDGRWRRRRRREWQRERERERGWSLRPPHRLELEVAQSIRQGTLVLAGLTRCYMVFVHLVKMIGAIKKYRRCPRPLSAVRLIMVGNRNGRKKASGYKQALLVSFPYAKLSDGIAHHDRRRAVSVHVGRFPTALSLSLTPSSSVPPN